jgi:hypothetical protein
MKALVLKNDIALKKVSAEKSDMPLQDEITLILSGWRTDRKVVKNTDAVDMALLRLLAKLSPDFQQVTLRDDASVEIIFTDMLFYISENGCLLTMER